MIRKLLRYYHTLRHLKPTQLGDQLAKRFVPKGKPPKLRALPSGMHAQILQLRNPMAAYQTYVGKHAFNFLNVTRDFGPNIN